MPTMIDNIFEIEYPSTLVFGHQREKANGTPFVTSSGRNNGVAGRVAPISGATLYPAGSITVPLKGSVMCAFLQPEPFYCAHQIAVLVPKAPMSDAEKLFYVACLRANMFLFSYGRQADRSFRNLSIPDRDEVPEWVHQAGMEISENADRPLVKGAVPPLDTKTWEPFKLESLFDIRKGKRLTKAEMSPGETPFVSAIESNNGVRQYVNAPSLHPENVITVNYNGNGVAEAFYQPQPFRASDDVNVLYPRFKLDAPLALFICTLIRAEKYRFSYGRKWALERMRESIIKLPVQKNGKPDWHFMRRFITRLPFSSQIAA